MPGALSAHPSLACCPVPPPLGAVQAQGQPPISGDPSGAGSRVLLLLLFCEAGTTESPAQSPEGPPEDGGPLLSRWRVRERGDACERRRAVGEGLGGRRASCCLPSATKGFPQGGWLGHGQPPCAQCCQPGLGAARWDGRARPALAVAAIGLGTYLGHPRAHPCSRGRAVRCLCARRPSARGEQERRPAR